MPSNSKALNQYVRAMRCAVPNLRIVVAIISIGGLSDPANVLRLIDRFERCSPP